MSVAIAVCELFAREAAAALETDKDVTIATFPAHCGRPPLDAAALARVVARENAPCAALVGCACGANLTDRDAPTRLAIHRLPQCFHLVAQPSLVDRHLARGAYLVTPGWLTGWRDRVSRLGLDEATAPVLFGESAARVVLLDTGVDPSSARDLVDFSEFVGLPCETVDVGIDYARQFLARLALESRLEAERLDSLAALRTASRQSADHAAALDLVGLLTRITTERQAVRQVLDVCTMLFAPRRVVYTALAEGSATLAESSPPSQVDPAAALDRLSELADGHLLTPDGFVLRIEHQGEILGVLAVEGLAFPEQRQRYLALALTVGKVVGLAVANARTYDRVKRAEEALRAGDERKNEFLAVLSHELRNPLTPIRNSLVILDRAPPGGEQARRARVVIGRQVAHLARLVDDLLDVTRISRGKVLLQRERLELGDLVRRTVEDHRSTFVENGIELEGRIASEGMWLTGDATRIAQVVGNLLGNAAKFTSRGGRVEVTLERRGSTARLRVRDTGVGIAGDMLGRLFQPFTQSEQTLDRSRGGLGLGLALVKGIVELHGGAASAASEGPGRGAEFMVSLPLEPVPVRPASAAEAPPPRSRRVLLIEDNIDAADSLNDALELMGHEVRVAYDGPSGIAAAREFRPELVLCDVGLPEMDGYEVARRFRADPLLRGIVLVALTGYALPEDQKRATDAGFARHVAKPPSLEVLERVLAEP